MDAAGKRDIQNVILNSRVCINDSILILRLDLSCIIYVVSFTYFLLLVRCSMAEDSGICSRWGQSYCELYTNVRAEYCPYMCNICFGTFPESVSSSTGIDFVNNVHMRYCS